VGTSVFADFLCTEGSTVPLNLQFEAKNLEESWSRQALNAFYEDGWIQDVLYRVKVRRYRSNFECQAATGGSDHGCS
jgi:hypothetical protein